MENLPYNCAHKRNQKQLEQMIHDESGYASFHNANNLHNSTLDSSSMLVEYENENAHKLPRKTTNQRQNSINNKNLLNILSAINTDTATTTNSSSLVVDYQETLQLKQQQQLQGTVGCPVLISNVTDENSTPTLHNQQVRSATKRQKKCHHKHLCDKKSKRNLFPSSPVKQHHYDGVQHLDIIGMLHNMPVVLENILSNMNASTLQTMTQVSSRWQQIIYSNRRAAERLHIYQLKLNMTKENVHHGTIKRTHIITNNTLPLQISNSGLTTGQYSHLRMTTAGDSSEGAISQLLLSERRVKCPLCGKSSKVFNPDAINSSNNNNNSFNNTAMLSHTLPIMNFTNDNNNDNSSNTSQLVRFSSLDAVIKTTGNESNHVSIEFPFAECTGAVCKFKFCLHCSCAYHGSSKCPVTELGTPSKISVPKNNATTPPKRVQKQDPKVTRKKSLKRLCF